MRRLLERGDLRAFAGVLAETWEQKKRLAAGISTPRIDELYELARKRGALGGKIAGAGGGGSVGDRLDVRLAPTRYDLTVAQVVPAPLGFVPLLRLEPVRTVGIDAFLRAAVDLALAASLLLALMPAAAWVVLRALVRGVRPILVEQQVVGFRAQPTRLRLLHSNVTRAVLLRGVPSLVDVLRGRLALVGPRPVPIEDRGAYQRWAGLLFAMKPGLTGPWRLAGPGATPEERVLADVWWVRNWSIWQHLFVLFQSARGLLGAGASAGIGRWLALPASTVSMLPPARGHGKGSPL